MEGDEESCYDNVVTGTLDRISFTATAVSLFNVTTRPSLLRVQPLLFHVVLSALAPRTAAINQNNDHACCQKPFEFNPTYRPRGSARFQTQKPGGYKLPGRVHRSPDRSSSIYSRGTCLLCSSSTTPPWYRPFIFADSMLWAFRRFIPVGISFGGRMIS